MTTSVKHHKNTIIMYTVWLVWYTVSWFYVSRMDSQYIMCAWDKILFHCCTRTVSWLSYKRNFEFFVWTIPLMFSAVFLPSGHEQYFFANISGSGEWRTFVLFMSVVVWGYLCCTCSCANISRVVSSSISLTSFTLKPVWSSSLSSRSTSSPVCSWYSCMR